MSLILPFTWHTDRWPSSVDTALRQVCTTPIVEHGDNKVIALDLAPSEVRVAQVFHNPAYLIRTLEGIERRTWPDLTLKTRKTIGFAMMELRHTASLDRRFVSRLYDPENTFSPWKRDDLMPNTTAMFQTSAVPQGDRIILAPDGLIMFNENHIDDALNRGLRKLTQEGLDQLVCMVGFPPREPGNHAALAVHQAVSALARCTLDHILPSWLGEMVGAPDLSRIPTYTPLETHDDF